MRVKDQNSEVILKSEKSHSEKSQSLFYSFTVNPFIEAPITDNMRVSVCKNTQLIEILSP